MNQRQKKLVRDLVRVGMVTVVMIVGMVHFRDYVNRSEAMRAMQHLGRIVTAYRQQSGHAPPVRYVEEIRDKLQGSERLGRFVYRARWIKFGAGDDEILAYSIRQNRSPFSRSGAIVLRLDGRVEWMAKNEFEKLLAKQQSQLEIEMTKKK